MGLIISSSFSINMLPATTCSEASFEPLSLDEARSLITGVGGVKNMVNPRHESTAVLSELLCGKAAEGGFLNIKDGERVTILVMLPPREFMNRAGAEIEIEDLNQVQFFRSASIADLTRTNPSRVGAASGLLFALGGQIHDVVWRDATEE